VSGLSIAFHGAAREVTGSCHLLERDGSRMLLDCGLIQGGRERHERNREPFPFDPAGLDCVVLSHAHIDHSGRLPLLCKAGFDGPILTTPPTAELCRILLADSGRIQEEDARWKIKRLEKKGEDASWVRPLYTEEDALAVLERLVPVEFESSHDLDGSGRVRFVPAGHILGAAIVELTLDTGSASRRIVFSGDLGVEGARLLGAPESVERPDYLLMESTYGDRAREEEGDRTELLHGIIERTVNRGGKVVIPSFAVGRAQELLARINDLVESGRLSGLPVYIDSPMAVRATRVFARHPEAYSDEAQHLRMQGDEPLRFPGLRLTGSVEESIAINTDASPAVIISASGMCTAGRVKHHLKHNIGDARNTVLFVGYQAHGTLGRVIQSGVSPVRIFGEWHTVRARIETIHGFSAHADRDELIAWFAGLDGAPRRSFIVHGEEQAAVRFGETLRERFGATVDVPEQGQRFDLD
jgi:metallo-beta-lactamase family protein